MPVSPANPGHLRYLLPMGLSLLVSGMVCGCDDPADESTPAAQPPSNATDEPGRADGVAEPAAVPSGSGAAAESGRSIADSSTATGTFAGVVTFTGELPAPRVVQATKDREICSAGEGEVLDVIVTDGKLQGAVIELTVKPTPVTEIEWSADAGTIHQKNCRFSPRLLVVPDNFELTIYNDDQVEHNVNTAGWNVIQSPGPEPIKRRITYSGTPFSRVTCNIHSWMETWVYVARSPYVASSAEDGSFRIEDVPAGSRIRGTVSHTTLGKQRFTIDVQPDETTNQDFVFEGK